MEIRVSAQEPGMSPSVYESNPDDKEISDDDDDDRNHKHRRRDDNTRSHSLDDDVTEEAYTKPYRRGSKSSQNGHLYGHPGSHSNETWKKYSFNPLEKDISTRFDQKRPGFTHFPRGPSDLNQKIRVNVNQPFPVDPGAVRGRGRESGLWSHQRDPRFNPNDIASQIVQQGSVPHSLFAGRGSNSRGPSWSPFGLVPGLPNGGPDMHMIHPLGLQGKFRPGISPLNMGLARQRCRDFEEQGFCLRGDMCPMEHGMNRIVVEDVQSLSQFNLPVSLASANLSIPPSGTGPSLATIVTTNSKELHGKNIKRENGLDIIKTLNDSAAAADFYDPDQPLWGSDSHTSPAISQPNVSKTDSLLDPSPSGNHHDDYDNEPFGAGVGPTRSSVHDRITTTKNPSNEIAEAPVGLNSGQDPPFHQKLPGGNGRMIRKPSQKAQRTLFVNGIPHQNNKRESLISHFKRFGEVIDIYIPLNSERAFVQFSKREEAEAALMAPDAVMGNRFIKLWWANRDNIIPPHGSTVSTVPPYNKGKDDSRTTLQNDITAPMGTNVTKTTPPLQKKLEVLKEELRKKQELLDQKRNDFRRKLDKLEKQATGVKGEVESEQVAKKQKVGVLADSAKAATSSFSDRDTVLPSVPDDMAVNSSKAVTPNSKTTPVLALQESPMSKSLPVVTNLTNRFKLDNRPTAFKIIPPLPEGLADVSVLKEHFSTYGDVSKVQLNDTEPIEIYLTSRHAAEKAFLSGKNWKGHKLQFVWLNSNKTPATTSKPNSQDSPTKPVVEISKPSTCGDGGSEKTQVKEPERSNGCDSSEG